MVPKELVLVQGKVTPERLSLKECAKVVMGKDDKCHMRINERGVGRMQCYVLADGDRHFLVNLSGGGGVSVNGKKVEERLLLRKGDIIGIGTAKIRYI